MFKLDEMACPLCGRKKMFELSAITPALVRCAVCGATHFLYYLQGYWDGYQKAEENKHIRENAPSLTSAGG